MLVAAIVTYFFAGSLAGIYTDDPALLREAIITVAFLSLVYVPDGGQVLMAHALRGRKDVWAPSMIQMVSFFGVMVPVGYTSAFIFEAGVVGLFQGILAGCIVSLIWLSIRFQWLAKQDAKNKIAESL